MSVRIKVLDGEEKTVGRATGFFIERGEKAFLITCWHVVTGYKYPSVGAAVAPIPKFLEIEYKAIESPAGGQTQIGQAVRKKLDLYRGTKPSWYQQGPNPEFELENKDILQIPYNLDVVAIEVDLDSDTKRFLVLKNEDVTSRIPELGEKVLIIGYPHGYSVLLNTPEPLVVTRHIAAKITERPHTLLADGVGARGMSGSPVYCMNSQHFYLLGIYKGAIIAVDELHETKFNDFYASLGEIERASSAFSFLEI